MTPRSALYVALVGLVMAVLCTALIMLVVGIGEPPGAVSDAITVGILLLDGGFLLGLVVLAVGLVLAGVLAFTKQPGKPS
jgi:hypothetical protein